MQLIIILKILAIPVPHFFKEIYFFKSKSKFKNLFRKEATQSKLILDNVGTSDEIFKKGF